MKSEWLLALGGGALIGASASAMLLFNGKITGISGIFSGLLKPTRGDISWRLVFLAGLLLGGLILRFAYPAAFPSALSTGLPIIALAGLLVGFGTKTGNGCTSGHGVCGISRFSPRSIAATITFIAAGMLIRSLITLTGVAL